MIRGLLTGTALGAVTSGALLLALSQVLPMVEIKDQPLVSLEAAFGLEAPETVLAASPMLEPAPVPSDDPTPPLGAPELAAPSPGRPTLGAPSETEVAVAPAPAPTALAPRVSDVPPTVSWDVASLASPLVRGIALPTVARMDVSFDVALSEAPRPTAPTRDAVAALGLVPPAALAPRISNRPPSAAFAVAALALPPLVSEAGTAPSAIAAPSRAEPLAQAEAPSLGAFVIVAATPPTALRPRLSDVPPQAGQEVGGPLQPDAPSIDLAETASVPRSGELPIYLPPRPVTTDRSGVETAPRTLAPGPTAPPLLAEGPALSEPAAGPVPPVPARLASATRLAPPVGPRSQPSRDVIAEALPPLPQQAGAQTDAAVLAAPSRITTPRAPSGIDALNPPVVDAALSQPVPAEPPVSGAAPAPLGGADEAPPRVLPRITVVGQEDANEEALLIPPEQPALVAHAVSFERQGDAPLLGVVLIDGPAAQGLELTGLTFPLAVAVDPLDPNATARMAELRAAGLEVLVLAPVAPGAQAADLEIFFEAVFSAVPEAVAVMDLPGSALQRQRALAGHAVSILKASGHGFVTYDKGLNAAVRLAEREAVPVAKVARVFDEKGLEGFAVRRLLDQGAFQAGRDGGAVLLGGLTAEALETLAVWRQSSKGRSVQFAPVSAVLQR